MNFLLNLYTVSQAPSIRGSGVGTHWVGGKEGLDCDQNRPGFYYLASLLQNSSCRSSYSDYCLFQNL